LCIAHFSSATTINVYRQCTDYQALRQNDWSPRQGNGKLFHHFSCLYRGIKMASKRILLLEGIHPVAVERLEAAGFQVDREKGAMSEDELCQRIGDYSAVGLRSKTQITDKVLDCGKNLWAIGTFCIGTNQVRLDTANKLGVPVFNAPYSNTRSVAELVIAEMVALSRQLGDRSANAHQGKWSKSATGAHEIRGKTLGIVGYGHIGSQVSVLAEAMGLTVLYYDVVKKLPLGNSKACDTFEELLQQSDFVTFHVPATDQTKKMMGKEQIALMKDGAYLLNASRGTVVIIDDLVDALKSKKLAGAAVDVFPVEPKNNDQAFESPLMGLPNVILTPHIGGSTEEAQEAIGGEVSQSFINYLINGSTYGAVNFPNLDPPVNTGEFRLYNVHRNVPGVLGEINGIVSSLGLNIKSQHLATDAEIGYLVMGLDGGHESELFDKVNSLTNSIKTRVD
jgi:D-3-phosphoglycerate dehydrogenase